MCVGIAGGAGSKQHMERGRNRVRPQRAQPVAILLRAFFGFNLLLKRTSNNKEFRP